MKTRVVVRTSCYGGHSWPDAPDDRRYLGLWHRHKFEVEVAVEVTLDDREIEFHDLLALVNGALNAYPPSKFEPTLKDFKSRSCEMIAKEVLLAVRMAAGLSAGHPMRVAVFEDGENGSEVET